MQLKFLLNAEEVDIFFCLISMLIFSNSVAGETFHGLYFEQLHPASYAKIPDFFSSPEDAFICLHSEKDPLVIGLVHQIKIHAPLEKLVSAYEDFDHYAELFSPLTRSSLVKGEDPQIGPQTFLVDFQSEIPLPFVPDTRYQMKYIRQHNSEKLTVYSFELSQSKDLKSLDGLSVFKKIGPDQTLYEEIDFLDAHWGIAKTLAPGSIWTSSIEEMIRSDFVMKLKLESPELSNAEVRKKSKKQSGESLVQEAVKKCIQGTTVASSFLADWQKKWK